ncbi:hypothetical protein [Actinacidiphila acidipaludis]|uniref:DUF4229 domain-containing protein n=1 Tax=Actinacidiphila acidipaludis TaxID=2873382 RepID=A0ABS7Q709_9ACTN|nr:hypothetical protein [Streptomyces acidipaludis]MBY8878947.1 hypothetical protein [Streptomyces acidipaludis]
MSDQRRLVTPRQILVRGVPFDALIVLLWRFGWGRSWAASLITGAVLASLTAAVALYSWWVHRSPERVTRVVAKAEAKEGNAAARRAAQAAAAEAANRSSGRQPGTRY